MKNFILEFKLFLESFGAGSILTSDQTGSEANDTLSLQGHPVFLPSLDLAMNNGAGIPQTHKNGIVKFFNYNNDPISIELYDKTKIFLTKAQYDRIPGDKPIVPNYTKIFIVFQRNPKDLSLSTSKIEKCTCKFTGPDWMRKQFKIKNNSSL
jgi:hypothetical protein